MEIKLLFMRRFLLCLLLCLGGGWLTGWVTEQGIKEWYPRLIKPLGTPPNLVFPLVWSILYICMALALTLLWNSHTSQKKQGLVFFGLQLFLNFIWSWLFFYLHQPAWALINLTLLWIFIGLTIQSFWRHTPYGSYLLLPYWGWVTYAFYLNLFIWMNN